MGLIYKNMGVLHLIFEMTIQIRVDDFKKGQKWYETLFNRKPDFVPHDGFAEWELIPGCWLQLAEGTPAENCGPIRFGVKSIEEEKLRLTKQLNIADFTIFSRKEVPVKWCTFRDPWGNLIGLFEYLDKSEENERIQAILNP